MAYNLSVDYKEDEKELARLAKAMGHPARIAILSYLASLDSCCFGGINKELPISKATVSQHLAELKDAGLIDGTIMPPKVSYCINKKNWERAIQLFGNFFEQSQSAHFSFTSCCSKEAFTIRKADNNDIESINNLLQTNNLPQISQIKESDSFFVAINYKFEIVAAIGLEVYAQHGLLRSMVVDAKYRNRGLAGLLVDKIEQTAKEQKLISINLLTTTADKYFAQKGYSVVTRNEMPLPVQSSDEFFVTCPVSAIVMKKEIDYNA
jgi:N-acetylglutamate synthase-like GNAT family acetyltransferase/DNA-binding HxlR family transcriptional regulator